VTDPPPPVIVTVIAWPTAVAVTVAPTKSIDVTAVSTLAPSSLTVSAEPPAGRSAASWAIVRLTQAPPFRWMTSSFAGAIAAIAVRSESSGCFPARLVTNVAAKFGSLPRAAASSFSVSRVDGDDATRAAMAAAIAVSTPRFVRAPAAVDCARPAVGDRDVGPARRVRAAGFREGLDSAGVVLRRPLSRVVEEDSRLVRRRRRWRRPRSS
jgi:hypothetical protein